MKTSLHGHYKLSSKLSGYEITLMSYCCRNRKTRYISIRNHSGILDLICKFTQTTA